MRLYQTTFSTIVFTCLGALLLASKASAVTFEPLSDAKRLATLCDAVNTHSQDPEQIFFVEVEGFSLLPYSAERGVMALDSSQLQALSGTLLFDSLPGPLETPLSPDAAKRLSTMATAAQVSGLAAFRVDTSRACIIDRSTQKTTYRLPSEILLLEITRKSNGRPLLRYETDAYSQAKTEVRRKVVFTEPTVLEGDPSVSGLTASLASLRPVMRGCYAKALAENQQAQGTLTAKLWLDTTGNTQDVDVTIDTLGDEVARRCVADALRVGKFAATEKAASFSVTIYFLQD